jgi:hypothetical protein
MSDFSLLDFVFTYQSRQLRGKPKMYLQELYSRLSTGSC